MLKFDKLFSILDVESLVCSCLWVKMVGQVARRAYFCQLKRWPACRTRNQSLKLLVFDLME